jgi:hypothetical protein
MGVDGVSDGSWECGVEMGDDRHGLQLSISSHSQPAKVQRTARYNKVQQRTARYSTVQQGTARNSKIQQDTARYSKVQHGTARYSKFAAFRFRVCRIFDASDTAHTRLLLTATFVFASRTHTALGQRTATYSNVQQGTARHSQVQQRTVRYNKGATSLAL